jgi:hypothetical protein
VAHVDLVLPADAPFWVDPQTFQPSFAISPDGATIVYACARGGATQLCLRRLDRPDVAPTAGTQGARYPAFSPDGRRVVFCVTDRRDTCEPGAPIKTLAVADGRIDTLGAVPDAMLFALTFSWTADDRILVSGYGGIWAMPAGGGASSPLVRADAARGEISFINAALLPGGARMIFARVHQQGGAVGTELRVVTLATGEQHTVLKDVSDPRYLPSGHLLYQEGLFVQHGANAGRLVAAPFDAARLEAGPPVRLLDPIRQTGSWMAFAVSHTGTLLYLPYETDRVLTWVDRQQRAVPALAAKRAWSGLRLSPDGRRAAVETTPERSRLGIEIVDFARGISTPFAADGRTPVWTRDGARIAFSTGAGERLVWQASDGSGAPEVLHAGEIDCYAGSWSPDGRLGFNTFKETRTEVWVLSREGASWVPRRFLSATPPQAVWVPRFSPDGRWMAYQGNESGTTEIYVQAYPEGGQRTQVSSGGGHDPVWSPDGRELFYRNGDSFYAVPVSAGRPFTAGSPRVMFSGPYLDSGEFAPSNYDVSPDGQRFLVVRVSDEERAPRRFHLVQNWLEEVKAKVPAR